MLAFLCKNLDYKPQSVNQSILIYIYNDNIIISFVKDFFWTFCGAFQFSSDREYEKKDMILISFKTSVITLTKSLKLTLVVFDMYNFLPAGLFLLLTCLRLKPDMSIAVDMSET